MWEFICIRYELINSQLCVNNERILNFRGKLNYLKCHILLNYYNTETVSKKRSDRDYLLGKIGKRDECDK